MIKSFLRYEDALDFADTLVSHSNGIPQVDEGWSVEIKYINHQWRVGIYQDKQQLEFEFDITD